MLKTKHCALRCLAQFRGVSVPLGARSAAEPIINLQETSVQASRNGSTFAARERTRKDKKKSPTALEATAEAIAAKGFLRSHRSYAPPSDVDAKLDEIFMRTVGNDDAKIRDLQTKAAVLLQCSSAFDHPVPNSVLCEIDSLDKIRQFYKTTVNTTTPLDKMRNMDLPENLHIQFEYHRFRAETDTKFKGITAFPQSKTIVTGLKYKDKYEGDKGPQTYAELLSRK